MICVGGICRSTRSEAPVNHKSNFKHLTRPRYERWVNEAASPSHPTFSQCRHDIRGIGYTHPFRFLYISHY